jgi:hypothetical protein
MAWEFLTTHRSLGIRVLLSLACSLAPSSQLNSTDKVAEVDPLPFGISNTMFSECFTECKTLSINWSWVGLGL